MQMTRDMCGILLSDSFTAAGKPNDTIYYKLKIKKRPSKTLVVCLMRGQETKISLNDS